MFIVFNKRKIYSYMVALSTVVILFMLAATFTNQINSNVIATSGKVKEIPIYQVETKENKVAFTMNCAWAWFQMSEMEK